MPSEKVYQIALTLVPNIGTVHAKTLVERFGSATAIFSAPVRELEAIEGIGEVRARSIRRFSDFKSAESQLLAAEKQGIASIFIGTSEYPRRLLNCYDPPTLLYCKGNIQTEQQLTVGIIGTRLHSEYGRLQTEKLIRKLASLPVTIISGMAFGIDGVAHKAALTCGLPTIGVMANGLDIIYPTQHHSLAREMLLHNGGLMTEYPIGVQPEKHHFPVRNRVVAGLCDAIIVMETSIKGGSMITASLANDYNREVFAFPGRAGDSKSSGCNLLIRQHKASLITDAESFLQDMGWELPARKKAAPLQMSLLPQPNPETTAVFEAIQQKETVTVDELYRVTGLGSGTVAAAILSLEMINLIECLPGKRYRRKP
jgi:DNA processing protein